MDHDVIELLIALASDEISGVLDRSTTKLQLMIDEHLLSTCDEIHGVLGRFRSKVQEMVNDHFTFYLASCTSSDEIAGVLEGLAAKLREHPPDGADPMR